MNKSICFLFSLVCLIISIAAVAAEDVPGAGDHPLIERIAGSHIAWFELKEFERITLPTGPYSRSDGYDSVAALDGEHLRIVYRFTQPVSTLRIYSSYQQA